MHWHVLVHYQRMDPAQFSKVRISTQVLEWDGICGTKLMECWGWEQRSAKELLAHYYPALHHHPVQCWRVPSLFGIAVALLRPFLPDPLCMAPLNDNKDFPNKWIHYCCNPPCFIEYKQVTNDDWNVNKPSSSNSTSRRTTCRIIIVLQLLMVACLEVFVIL